MKRLNVLWLDDNSPLKVAGDNDVDIVTAHTCADAESILNSKTILPNWIVVDLIVPQGGWGEHAFDMPGLNYVEHIRSTYGGKIGIIVFSIAMPPELKEAVIQAGAIAAFAKTSKTWVDIIQDLKQGILINDASLAAGSATSG